MRIVMFFAVLAPIKEIGGAGGIVLKPRRVVWK